MRLCERIEAAIRSSKNADIEQFSVPVAVPAPPVQHEVQTAPVVSAMPAQAQADPSTQAALPSPPLVQATSSGGTGIKTSDGPKTRSQVRAEIVRARENGGLPAFGNPDPAGPGGAPSLTGAPRP